MRAVERTPRGVAARKPQQSIPSTPAERAPFQRNPIVSSRHLRHFMKSFHRYEFTLQFYLTRCRFEYRSIILHRALYSGSSRI